MPTASNPEAPVEAVGAAQLMLAARNVQAYTAQTLSFKATAAANSVMKTTLHGLELQQTDAHRNSNPETKLRNAQHPSLPW